MRARKARAAVVLGAFLAMLPARWAAARAPECESPPAAGPASAAPKPHAPAQAADDETPARWPRRERRTSVDPNAPPGAPPLLLVDPRMLEGASFYETVGRPDLAAGYRTRHGLKIASRVVGGVSLGLGALTWVAVRALEAGFSAPFCVAGAQDACGPPKDTLWVPDIMMAGGLALLVAPLLWSNDPVSLEEKVALARGAFAGTRPSAAVMWSFAPAPGGQGGTLLLSGRF
jgi:hypothetical protein